MLAGWAHSPVEIRRSQCTGDWYIGVLGGHLFLADRDHIAEHFFV